MSPDDSTVAPGTTAVWHRAHGAGEWTRLPRVTSYRQLHPQDHAGSLAEIDLDASAAGVRSGGAVIVAQRYAAAADIRYFPHAFLVPAPGGGNRVRLDPMPAGLPDLPAGLAGWEVRYPTHLTYTARPHQIDPLLEALRAHRPEEA